MKKVADEVFVDLWICRHFKVLPTDQRYKDLTDSQKALLFTSFLESPRDDTMWMAYQESIKNQKIDDGTANNLKKLGYTDEQIRRIQGELERVRRS